MRLGRASGMQRVVIAALIALAVPAAGRAQAPHDSDSVKHVAVAPVAGIHFGEWQYASVTIGVRAIRRRWWAMESGVEPGVAAIAAIEPGIAGVRAGVDFGWIGVEYEAPKKTKWVAEVVGAQLGPSLLQTWARTHVADHPTTYAGIDARIKFIAGVAGGLYWRVAGRDGSRRRMATLSFGFGY